MRGALGLFVLVGVALPIVSIVLASLHLNLAYAVPPVEAAYLSLNVLTGASPIAVEATLAQSGGPSVVTPMWTVLLLRVAGWLFVPAAFTAFVTRRLEAVERDRQDRMAMAISFLGSVAERYGLNAADKEAFTNIMAGYMGMPRSEVLSAVKKVHASPDS